MLFYDMTLEIVYCVSRFYMISLGHAVYFMLTVCMYMSVYCILLGRKQASYLFNYHSLQCGKHVGKRDPNRRNNYELHRMQSPMNFVSFHFCS